MTNSSDAQMLPTTSNLRPEKCVEYEELVLHRPAGERPRLLRYRNRPQSPLGITLCYGTYFGLTSPASHTPDSADTNIFVAAIDDGSVAERDGRIRVGDQILQINGVSIHSRRDAIEQFSKPAETVRLLLARSHEDENEDDLNITTEKQPALSVNGTNVVGTQNIALRCNSVTEKTTDSGLSRGTDDSEDHETPLLHNLPHDAAACFHFLSGNHHENEMSADDSRLILEESLEADLAQLHREMETIRLECERLIRRHVTHNTTHSGVKTDRSAVLHNSAKLKNSTADQKSATCQLPNRNNMEITKTFTYEADAGQFIQESKLQIEQAKTKEVSIQRIQGDRKNWQARRQSAQLPLFPEETSSSAYNTGGDSCRSTPLKHDANTATYDVIDASSPTLISTQQLLVQREDTGRRPQQLSLSQRDKTSNTPTSTENFYHTIETPTMLTVTSTSVGATQLSAPDIKHFRLPKLRIRDEWPLTPRRMRSKTQERANLPPRKSSKTPESSRTAGEEKSENARASVERLAETIALQQRLLREAMIGEATILGGVAATTGTAQATGVAFPAQLMTDVEKLSKRNTTDTSCLMATNIARPHCPLISALNPTVGDLNSQFEWKVKRRPDGTRYITRRPIRAQVMKAREEEVNRERFALSTDDDAASELKLGRFWSRDERKRHLERAKQRKHRHMKLIHEKAKRAAAGEKELLQLSRAKQSRRNKHHLYDRFTTVQELLAHGAPYGAADGLSTSRGARGPEPRVINVTTV